MFKSHVSMTRAVLVALVAAFVSSPVVAAQEEVDLFDTDYFHSAEFKRRFAEAFISVSDVEPGVSPDEAEELQEILDLIQRSDDAYDGEDEAKKEEAEERQAKRNERAMSKLLKARTDASSANYSYLIGQLHQADGRAEEAIEAYERAVDKYLGYPRFRRAWQQIGLLYFQRATTAEQGDPVPDYRRAANAYSRAISLGLYDDISFGIMGVSLLNANHVLPAETAFRQAMMMNPSDNQWMMGLAQCLFRGQRFADAVTLLDGMLTEQPENASWWMLQGNAYIGLEKPERAARSFQIAENLGGGTTASLNILGDIYVNSGLTDVAVEKYMKALTADANATPDRALRAARLLTGRGDVVEAAKLLEGVEAHFGADLPSESLAEVLKMRAKIAAREGRAGEELTVLRQIVDNDPLDGDGVILLAEALTRADRVDEALQFFEIAGEIDGFEARAKLSHGQALVGQKRFAEAVPLLKASLDIQEKESVRRYMESVEKIARSAKK